MRRGLRHASPSHRRKRRQRRGRILVITLVVTLGVVGVAAVGGYGYAHWRFGQIASVDVPGLAKPPPPGKPTVLLVVGSDSRAELDQPGDATRFGTAQDAGGVRSDVIMLVRVDPAVHTVKILSIPRDLLVPITGTGGRGKINAAFAGGPAQLIQTIQTQFHIPVNHYLLVNFDGFRAIINTLGGVRLDFPYPAADALSGLHITRAGCQRLDGDQALALARSRHYRYSKDGRWYTDPLSDLGRIQRQQTFLRVVLATAIAKGLTNPVRANQFVGAVVHDLTKDRGLSEADAVGLARQFRSFNPDQLAGQTLPVTIANNYQGFGDVLLTKQPDADRAIASFLGRPAPAATTTPTPAQPVVVRVQNGTRTAGLAARTASSLRQQAVNATNAGNAPRASRSQVHYRPGEQPAAQTLAGMLAGGAVLVSDASLPTGTMLVVLGAQFHGVRPTPAPASTTAPPARSAPITTPAQPRDFDPHPC
jgi:polyisoprenyl-teichoic acid--peptidoglycan teichoic acid transferase